MKQRKRMKRQSLKGYLATKHKWTATFCKYTETSTGTLAQVQNVDGAGRVRVPRGWFVSFFMTDKQLEKAMEEAKRHNIRTIPSMQGANYWENIDD